MDCRTFLKTTGALGTVATTGYGFLTPQEIARDLILSFTLTWLLIGAKSVLVAYGVNRGDWSFIPGGVASGTALIRPDLPELKEWPFFWSQTEYVIGDGSTNYMFLVLAAQKLLKMEQRKN